jgi:hypothetical protein
MAARLNIEEGFKRIIWIVSIAGALFGIAIFVYGSVTRIGIVRDLTHYRRVLAKANVDPEFIALSRSDQTIVRNDFEKRIKELELQEDWKGQLYGGLAFAVIWFVLVWIVFYTVKWIAQGFGKEKVPKV